MATVENLIVRFIAEEILRGASPNDLSVDQPLLEDGVLDSIGLQDLVTFLETDLSITLDDEHLVPENFESVRTIVELVERVRAAG